MERISSRSVAFLTTLALVLTLAVGASALAQNNDAQAGDGAIASDAIPHLPFADNPDPEACGIPQRVGSDDTAWLHGVYEGELIEPVVHLYDSHLRNEITGRAPSGMQVKVVLFQDNPVLNYYLVEATLGDGSVQKGWVPGPFLTFEAP